jgi:CheY-like chemotaxis protein/HPt (histidine-containing phosphotransfer) domain-containing protein
MLALWRIEVATASNAAGVFEAAERARRASEPFAAVLADASLPGAAGLALARALHERCGDPRPRLVLLCAGADRFDARTRAEHGVDACIAKPVQQSELFDALTQLLGAGPALAASGGEAAPSARSKPAPLNVLLTEDNLVNQELTRILLEREGHRVTVVANGREALDALETRAYDVVLMDVQMPVLNGFDATACIRERERGRGGHVAVIGLTAHAMTGDRERCLRAGMDDYVSKPIDPEKLFAAIRRARARGGRPSAPAAAAGPARAAACNARAPLRIDAAALVARMGGSMDILAQVAGVFVDSAPAMIDAIADAIAARDHESLRRAAHGFKGAVANFGVPEATEAARTLEFLGRDHGDWDAVAGAFALLRALSGEVVVALKVLQQEARG